MATSSHLSPPFLVKVPRRSTSNTDYKNTPRKSTSFFYKRLTSTSVVMQPTWHVRSTQYLARSWPSNEAFPSLRPRRLSRVCVPQTSTRYVNFTPSLPNLRVSIPQFVCLLVRPFASRAEAENFLSITSPKAHALEFYTQASKQTLT